MPKPTSILELLNSPAFRRVIENPRFQDFYQGSKLLSRDGEPVPLFTGTRNSFSVFDRGKGNPADHGWYGQGAGYLTPDSENASTYSIYPSLNVRGHENEIGFGPMREGSPSIGANVMPVFASLKKPYFWPEKRPAALNAKEAEELTRELRRLEYDGVVAPNLYAEPGVKSDFYEVMPFTSNQIKSIFNRGTFDPRNPDILKANGGAVAGLPRMR